MPLIALGQRSSWKQGNRGLLSALTQSYWAMPLTASKHLQCRLPMKNKKPQWRTVVLQLGEWVHRGVFPQYIKEGKHYSKPYSKPGKALMLVLVKT